MKTDSNFKMSKATKCMMANITDKNARDKYKKFAIDAEATRSKLERVIFKGNENKE